MKRKFIFPTIVILFILASCSHKRSNSNITVQELKKHVYYLTSDKLKGRYSATAELDSAVEYIRFNFWKAGLTLLGNNGLESFQLKATEKTNASVIVEKKSTKKVVALLKASEPILSKDYVIIGAHYGMGSSNTVNRQSDTLHYGADDDASGTALLLELAGKLARKQLYLRRNIIFVVFIAEEMGKEGSKFVVKDSIANQNQVDAIISLDRVGRMNKDRKLEVGGTGTTPVADSLLQAMPLANSLKLVFSPEGYSPANHAGFYTQDIPVFFFSTGNPFDYHTPTDTPAKINYKGLKLIGDYIDELVTAIANRKNPLPLAGQKKDSVLKKGDVKN